MATAGMTKARMLEDSEKIRDIKTLTSFQNRAQAISRENCGECGRKNIKGGAPFRLESSGRLENPINQNGRENGNDPAPDETEEHLKNHGVPNHLGDLRCLSLGQQFRQEFRRGAP